MADPLSHHSAPGQGMRRLLKLLSRSASEGLAYEHRQSCCAFSFAGRSQTFKASLVEKLVRQGLAVRSQGKLKVTRLGLDVLSGHPVLDVSPAHQSSSCPDNGAAAKQPVFNESESPLYRLYNRSFRDGRRYLDESEFAAGERLRSDFERGNLQPRITANWRGVAGQSGRGGGYGAGDVTDFAMDARDRVNAALRILGPELAGVALDICCFLKGFETVERERQWPPRSAKLMLKTALAQLARHYGLSGGDNRGTGKIISWGSEGYRPETRL